MTTAVTPATRDRPGDVARPGPGSGPGARRSLGARLAAPPDPWASLVALLFWAASLLPTLLPHGILVQGALTGTSLMIGYGIGCLARSLFRLQRRRTGWFRPSAQVTRTVRTVAVVVVVLLLTVGSWAWWRWQQSQRRLVGMSPLNGRSPVTMVLVAALVALVVLGLSRLLAAGCGRLTQVLSSRLGGMAARSIVTVACVVVVFLAFDQLVVNGVVDSTKATFAAGNSGTDPGVVQPTSPLESGGPGSLTPWDTLGRQGRNFAGEATSVAALRAFAGPGSPVMTPIRVYVGLQTAPTPGARAALALRELQRTGAFARSVLVVATATGTGWINPNASAAVEYLWSGDTAIVSMQYSYLPSWISSLTEEGAASTAGRDLVTAVSSYWSTLPPDHRPRLVLFGESLGSYGTEAGLARGTEGASVANLLDHSDGALFVGPTNDNPIWRQIVAGRAASSPVWRPVSPLGDVAVANSAAELVTSPGANRGRVVYLVHASDPVTWWDVPTLWWPPGWITGPHGPDVPSEVGWFPVVTWLQTTADLMAGFSTAPGHGHNYNNAIAGAFASLVPPPGWTASDSVRLSATVDRLNELGQNSNA
ncbi:MAG: alpha/beta hydrolase [Actinomycetota bacterium]|nr:alpha/beta hydrolase [Actinomycetota bacterium]